MKILKSIAFGFLLAGTISFIACGGDSNKTQEHSTHEHHGEGKEYTSAYVCPMHCEGSGSDAEGKCPVCGMDYVMQDDHVKDGHKH